MRINNSNVVLGFVSFIKFLDVYSISFSFCSPILVFIYAIFLFSGGFPSLPSGVISYKIVLVILFSLINILFISYVINSLL